jgi:hypothetical protein
MFILLAAAALAVLAIVATMTDLVRDGYRRRPTDHSRLP